MNLCVLLQPKLLDLCYEFWHVPLGFVLLDYLLMRFLPPFKLLQGLFSAIGMFTICFVIYMWIKMECPTPGWNATPLASVSFPLFQTAPGIQ